MRGQSKAQVDRRDLLRALGASAGAVAAPGALVSRPGVGRPSLFGKQR